MAMEFVNQAKWDRTLRVLIGAAMLLLGWGGVVSGLWGVALRVFGMVPLLTGLAGWCPVYAFLDKRTTDGRRRT